LYFDIPRGIVATSDGIEEILCMPIRIHGGKMLGFLIGKGLVALVLWYALATGVVGCRKMENIP
jgi:hypothetical protein